VFSLVIMVMEESREISGEVIENVEESSGSFEVVLNESKLEELSMDELNHGSFSDEHDSQILASPTQSNNLESPKSPESRISRSVSSKKGKKPPKIRSVRSPTGSKSGVMSPLHNVLMHSRTVLSDEDDEAHVYNKRSSIELVRSFADRAFSPTQERTQDADEALGDLVSSERIASLRGIRRERGRLSEAPAQQKVEETQEQEKTAQVLPSDKDTVGKESAQSLPDIVTIESPTSPSYQPVGSKRYSEGGRSKTSPIVEPVPEPISEPAMETADDFTSRKKSWTKLFTKVPFPLRSMSGGLHSAPSSPILHSKNGSLARQKSRLVRSPSLQKLRRSPSGLSFDTKETVTETTRIVEEALSSMKRVTEVSKRSSESFKVNYSISKETQGSYMVRIIALGLSGATVNSTFSKDLKHQQHWDLVDFHRDLKRRLRPIAADASPAPLTLREAHAENKKRMLASKSGIN